MLIDNFVKRQDAVKKCAIAADSFDYRVFGLRDGGWCVSGPTLHKTYDRDGIGRNCTNGKGAGFANSVYQITS